MTILEMSHLQSDLWKVRVDPNSLQNAIINLLVNSRDALEDGGQLIVRTRNWRYDENASLEFGTEVPNGDCVILEVNDNGDGMDQATLAQIFTPFFTTKSVGTGSGLGLSMVHGFVKQSGGSISVTSELGQGTSVKLFFLANTDEGSSETGLDLREPNQTPKISPSMAATFHILLAEDEPEVAAIIKQTLENEGYKITLADNGDKGFEIFQNNPSFDLILTDIMMPGELQGYGLAESCRELRPDIPVIFLSGYAKSSEAYGKNESFSEIRLMKPVSRAELLTAIRGSLVSSQN